MSNASSLSLLLKASLHYLYGIATPDPLLAFPFTHIVQVQDPFVRGIADFAATPLLSNGFDTLKLRGV